jgi:hypothetical protein
MEIFYNPIKDLLLNRYAIKVGIYAETTEMPKVCVEIVNQTPNTPVYVHSVRIHFGNKDFSRSFVLSPYGDFTVSPKSKACWKLHYENTKIVVTARMKKPPVKPFLEDSPGIDSPARLFDAIGRGYPKDSRIEIDFNEYMRRRYLYGKVQAMFDVVGKQMQEYRKNKKKMIVLNKKIA